MSNPIILFLFFIVFTIFSIDSAHSSSSSACPIDLSYVETYPWNTSSCHDPNDKSCCQTLISLIGLGRSQYLKETSMFQLPNATAASYCWSEFQARLAALSISPSLVPLCFYNSTQFVANSSSCAGIFTTKEWTEKVGPESQIDIACSNLSGSLLQCGSCVDAGKKVTSQSRTNKSSSQLSNKSLIRLVGGLFGAVVGVLLACGAIILYRKWDQKRKRNASHQQFVSSFKSSVLPSSGAKWFQVSELERATNGFSQKNMIGQGAKVLDTSNSSSFLLITDWAWMLVKTGKVEEIFDEFIRKEGPKGIMERFVQVGILCAHVMVAFRPTIADALKMLEGDIDIPKLPDRPLPLSHESFRSSLCNNVSTSEISESRSTFTT
ncbi:hypothetical protein Q3G72_015848 [Acer saccharum]|nr:hypothetical protein Q3G72_015848 [Acer saccharum]